MFHFETSFCVMGDSWWPRNTLHFFFTRKFKDETLGEFGVGFFLDQLVGVVGAFWSLKNP